MQGQVNVLISTYNGEKYIEEQIDSILAQTYPNIQIYVRDDASTDGTLAVLKRYEREKKIHLFTGKNIRYGRSFMHLLELASEGDYWAFCDQDDVWLPDKIKWAVEWFETQDERTPLLFHSAYELTDENLEKVIGTHEPPDYIFDFRRSLTDCLYQGFSIVFNRSLREKMLNCNIDNLDSHDWWACLMVTKFGKSYFDPRIASKHRRLEGSMSSGKLKSRVKWMLRTFQTGNSDIKSCAKEFVRVYDDGSRDAAIAKWFSHDSYHFADAVKKAFYPRRWRASLSSEIVLRFLMIFGKI